MVGGDFAIGGCRSSGEGARCVLSVVGKVCWIVPASREGKLLRCISLLTSAHGPFVHGAKQACLGLFIGGIDHAFKPGGSVMIS